MGFLKEAWCRITNRDLAERSDASIEEYVHRETAERDGHERAIQEVRERNARLLNAHGMPGRAAIESAEADAKREYRRRLVDELALDVLRGD